MRNCRKVCFIRKPVAFDRFTFWKFLQTVRSALSLRSHSWGTSFAHFVRSIRCHALSKEGSTSWIDAAYWICSFAPGRKQGSEGIEKSSPGVMKREKQLPRPITSGTSQLSWQMTPWIALLHELSRGVSRELQWFSG